MRVFLDANVLFTAAHNPGGKAALVIELGHMRGLMLFSSSYPLEEARRNLNRKSPRCLDRLHNLQQHLQVIEHRPEHVLPKGLAHKDQAIFQAAIACKATHLLTGDLKDFGPFMNQPDTTYGVCIQTVAEFLESLK